MVLSGEDDKGGTDVVGIVEVVTPEGDIGLSSTVSVGKGRRSKKLLLPLRTVVYVKVNMVGGFSQITLYIVLLVVTPGGLVLDRHEV